MNSANQSASQSEAQSVSQPVSYRYNSQVNSLKRRYTNLWLQFTSPPCCVNV